MWPNLKFIRLAVPYSIASEIFVFFNRLCFELSLFYGSIVQLFDYNNVTMRQYSN